MLQHTCYCGVVYDCEYCHTPQSFICPTLNDDEDGNLCPKCYDRMIDDMERFYNFQDSEEE